MYTFIDGDVIRSSYARVCARGETASRIPQGRGTEPEPAYYYFAAPSKPNSSPFPLIPNERIYRYSYGRSLRSLKKFFTSLLSSRIFWDFKRSRQPYLTYRFPWFTTERERKRIFSEIFVTPRTNGSVSSSPRYFNVTIIPTDPT